MSTVADVLGAKKRSAFTISERATALSATQLMNDNHIGALVVTRGDQVVGMFTERDVLRRIVAERRDPAKTKVADVMSKKVVCCTLDSPVNDVRTLMHQRNIRHVPVISEDGLVGLISVRDLNSWFIQEGQVTIQYMQDYVYGRA